MEFANSFPASSYKDIINICSFYLKKHRSQGGKKRNGVYRT